MKVVVLLIIVVIFLFVFRSKTLIIIQFGRFGNNAAQIRNAMNLALQYGITRIIHLKHGRLFNLPRLKPCTISDMKLLDLNLHSRDLFFFHNNASKITKILPNFDKELIDELLITKLMRDYYKQVFNFKYAPHDRDDLVIHIRSGDIFTSQKLYRAFVQPPYEYYRTIIMTKKWDSITIVAEDELNPVIPLLCHEFNIDFKQHDLKTDMETILNANTVVAGFGSFVPQVLSLSLGSKKVYYFYQHKIQRHDFEDGIIKYKTKPVKVDGYINEWLNTDEQRQTMLDFNLSQSCNMTEFYNII